MEEKTENALPKTENALPRVRCSREILAQLDRVINKEEGETVSLFIRNAVRKEIVFRLGHGVAKLKEVMK